MEEKSALSVQRIFNSEEFSSKGFGPARWLDDDTGYTTLEPAAASAKIKEIVGYDIVSGRRTVLVSAEQLQPAGKDKPLIIKNYSWSPNRKHLLIFTNSRRVWRENTRGDYWILDLETDTLTQLGGDAKPATVMFAKISPDNKSVAYARENNLYVESISGGQIIQLTNDGSKDIINGTSDWVYEEEFRLRDGFYWSPDSKHIAYWQFDTNGLQPFYMINNTDSLYPRLIPLPYPKAGTTNSACRIGVVSVDAAHTIWFDVPGDPRNQYIPKMEWAANSEQVLIQQLNRLQNRNRLLLGEIEDGSTRMILVEQDEAWIDIQSDLKWLEGGKAFTWLSDRDGWRHLFRVSRDGQEVALLTPGAFDVISIQKIAEESGWVYYVASPHNASQRYLYRARLDGSGHNECVTPADKPGTHDYQISPKASYAFHTYSTFGTPPEISLITLPEHNELRSLEKNEELCQAVSALKLPSVSFFQLEIEEGLLLDGWCIKPPDFNQDKKYPALFFVYGEPAGQTVLDAWGRKNKLWHLLLAQQGYLIISVDNRGTPSPRGRLWRKGVYRQVGILTTADQARAAEIFIESRPYIDADRVGVWGWSGGGSMTLNLMFKYPNLYKTGIAVAAVSDQRYYDTIYQERYMGLPNDNAEGYRNGSPITFADQLQGNLLIVHGTGDDNVHYQCAEALANALIRHDKHFSMMAYPNRSHAIKEGKNTQHHLYKLMTRFLQENLMNIDNGGQNDNLP